MLNAEQDKRRRQSSRRTCCSSLDADISWESYSSKVGGSVLPLSIRREDVSRRLAVWSGDEEREAAKERHAGEDEEEGEAGGEEVNHLTGISDSRFNTVNKQLVLCVNSFAAENSSARKAEEGRQS